MLKLQGPHSTWDSKERSLQSLVGALLLRLGFPIKTQVSIVSPFEGHYSVSDSGTKVWFVLGQKVSGMESCQKPWKQNWLYTLSSMP